MVWLCLPRNMYVQNAMYTQKAPQARCKSRTGAPQVGLAWTTETQAHTYVCIYIYKHVYVYVVYNVCWTKRGGYTIITHRRPTGRPGPSRWTCAGSSCTTPARTMCCGVRFDGDLWGWGMWLWCYSPCLGRSIPQCIATRRPHPSKKSPPKKPTWTPSAFVAFTAYGSCATLLSPFPITRLVHHAPVGYGRRTAPHSAVGCRSPCVINPVSQSTHIFTHKTHRARNNKINPPVHAPAAGGSHAETAPCPCPRRGAWPTRQRAGRPPPRPRPPAT